MADPNDPNQWLEEYGDYLFRRAMLLLGKHDAAEDLVQETLLSAYQSQSSFRGEASIKTWLTSILRNRAIDYLRKAVRREIPTDFEPSSEDERSTFSSWGIWKDYRSLWGVWERSAQDLLENEGMSAALLECMEKLPSSQRIVLKLKTVEDMSIEEICNELNLKTSNVSVLLFRARLTLRKCIDINWFKKT